MPDPQIQAFARQIQDKLPGVDSIEKAADLVAKDLSWIAHGGDELPSATKQKIEKAAAIVRKQHEEVEILRPSSIIKAQEKWYLGPQAGDYHWPALKTYLLNSGWDENAIGSINRTSSEVVSLLADPKKRQYRCRGLVVGYVQSGKTANMTAVIAKAVDAGYNLIVLLAGMTNKLRAQTQGRMESDLVNRRRHLWQLYTQREANGDFVTPRNGSFTMPGESRAQLAVMKKVTSRLEAFQRTIEKTPAKIRKELKVLLIDDECDEGSVNSASGEYDMTRINACIRKIVGALPAVSYVGYTATPFANVFIDPFPFNKDELDDLYPEDFITSLPRPEGYFGAKEVFGDHTKDPDEDEDGKDVIRDVHHDELDDLRPSRQADKDDFQPQVTQSLEEAILWFLAACAIRTARGQSKKHMTMLVHTSPFVIQHERMAKALEEWLSVNEEPLKEGRGAVYGRFIKVAQRELDAFPPEKEDHKIRPEFGELLPHLKEILIKREIAIENGRSDYRLDYSGEPKVYIVIGGAVLSRGLTLEGLMVSFFLRTSKQYDTLLQMGRWFGFRHGYEDLPRLWTTNQLVSSFRALSGIEEEIREDIEAYRKHGLTPMEFAVKVRTIPGMAITSAGKMKNAFRTAISYEGRHVQTIRFDHRSQDAVSGNWKAAARLVDSIDPEFFVEKRNGFLAKDVPVDVVRQFLRTYRISDHHMDLSREHLMAFVDKNPEMLKAWNVGVIHSAKGNESRKPLGRLGYVQTINRSKMKANERGFADIKALMSKRDSIFDVDNSEEIPQDLGWEELKAKRDAVPMLLLYPIDRHSAARADSTSREDLDAVDDLVGLGLVFPGSIQRGGGYYAVDLDVPTPEELDEIENVQLEETGELDND